MGAGYENIMEATALWIVIGVGILFIVNHGIQLLFQEGEIIKEWEREIKAADIADMNVILETLQELLRYYGFC